MSKYFGTDGFRGEASVDLTVEHAMKIGQFLGHYYGKGRKARVVIGKDTRLSSYMLEDALSAGLTASGADAYLLHVTTTPSVSYVVSTEGFDCGIRISASHNVFYDYGIKLLKGRGEKMVDEVILACESYLDGSYGPATVRAVTRPVFMRSSGMRPRPRAWLARGEGCDSGAPLIRMSPLVGRSMPERTSASAR